MPVMRGSDSYDFRKIVRHDVVEIFSSTKSKLEVYKKRIESSLISSDRLLVVVYFKGSKLVFQASFLEKVTSPMFQGTNLNININVSDVLKFSEIISRLIDEMFYRLSGIPWNIDDFFSILDDVSLQFVLSKLVSRFSEEEISTLIFALKKSGDRIRSNISKGAKEKVNLIVKGKEGFLSSDKEWIEATMLFTALEINRIIREDGQNLTSSQHIRMIRENIMNSFFIPRTSPKVISVIVEEIDKLGKLGDVLKYVDRTTLAKSLVGVDDRIISKFSNFMSRRGFDLLVDDVLSLSKREEHFLKERIEFLEGTTKLMLDHALGKDSDDFVKVVSDIIPMLNYSKIYYAVNLTGIAAYFLFSENLRRRNNVVLEDFLARTVGTLKNVVRMFLKGRILLVGQYGDTMIKEKTREFLEKLYFAVKMDECVQTIRI
ncbi:MAG: hypothetical protein ABDH28_07850 [Brevinematia bacterium]